ncbi:MAG: sensor histidine kinase [Trebonia sp.]
MTLAEPLGRRPRVPVLTVQSWFRLMFAVIAALVLITAGITAALLARDRTVSDRLQGAILPAQAQAYRLQAALLDQETGVRGYGITGDARFLQPYTQGLATEAEAAARLRGLVGRQQPMAADVASLERSASQWRRAYAVPLITRARHGPLNAKDARLLDQGKQNFDHLRALFAAQNAHLAAAATRARASVNHVRTIQTGIYVAILVVLLVVSAALSLLLRNTVVRPLSRLREASRRVVDGDFGHQIEPTGPADLWAVAADVEAMRGALVAALDAARAAQDVATRQAADLDAHAAELRRSNAELEQFAYIASHDLQEPLRKVASFCQLLEKRYGGELDERAHQYIDFAVDGAKRMQTLINDLLAFSRVGRTNDVRVLVPLDQTLDSAIAALGTAIEEVGAVIERPPQLPAVMGDPTLLTMLWQNLIANAIKFRVPDRVPVVRITVSADPDGPWTFCVEDNGIGIAPEFAEKVFVIFQRLHARDTYAGTGIGLAICKRIVEHHGGDISLDISYAQGARFCFTLPGVRPAQPDRADENSSTSAEGIPA